MQFVLVQQWVDEVKQIRMAMSSSVRDNHKRSAEGLRVMCRYELGGRDDLSWGG